MADEFASRDDIKRDLYRKYYEASRSDSEWSGVDARYYADQIDEMEEADSYQGGA